MFVKVFAQILDSSLADDYLVRLVFEDLLKLADAEGIVDMTPSAIARRTHVPLEIVLRGIETLSAPDPESRSSQEEGRRIVLLDGRRSWGWRIVNYLHYRNIRDEDGRRKYMREYMRNRRSPGKHSVNSVNSCKPQLAKAEAEAEAEAEASADASSVASLKPQKSFDLYLATWNEHCGSLAKISRLSDKRRAKLKTRISEGLTLETFRQMVVTCAKTPFLRGENDRHWKADFVWLLATEDNGLKVREGKYGKPDAVSMQTYRDPAALYDSPEYAAERKPA
jgi:hypothetical protein